MIKDVTSEEVKAYLFQNTIGLITVVKEDT